MDAAGVSHALLMYCFREREQILDILELVSGARLTTSYIRPGGVWKDVPPSFVERVQDVLPRLPEADRRIRADGHRQPGLEVAHHRHRQADHRSRRLRCACTGPMLRATGLAFDYRKARPYSGYENYDFKVPTATEGDTYARYLVPRRGDEAKACASSTRR